ncbi:hypothetical protein DL766_006271 [Monosporascus sp. MC13-8B]|nr:hypothetical protein DL763_004572 [Monosporascus cannonballus]RYP27676.1 hypothetical protein DL766_006271 [Monosporascus sp. MC13-8B]
MLPSSRLLLASSSRAIVRQRASISSLRRLPFQTVDAVKHGNTTAPRALTSQLIPSIQKTRYATKPPPRLQSERNPEEEKKAGERKLESNPAAVSSQSSVRHFYEPDQRPRDEENFSKDLRHDLNIVKDAFRLNTVPKESYVLGLAGTVPYLATSISTVYLSWDLNTDFPSQSQFINNLLISHESARHWLDLLEPLQLGYGAVIISFLGAIHWGLEYAERAPLRERTRFRYGLGMLAPAAAWPTLMLPVEFALTAQFGAFVALYWADTHASRRGWAPSWYAPYRFVLTAIVGAAIALSLIGRAKVGDAKPRLTGLGEKFREKRQGEQDYDEKWEELENKEREKIRKLKEEEEKEKKKKEVEKKAKEKEEKEKEEGKGKEENEDEK